MQNKPGLKTIALQGKIFFEMNRRHIKKIKELMESNMDFEEEEKEGAEDDDIINPRVASKMTVIVEDLCPFVCSSSQLNENEQFSKIKKR